MRLTRWRGTLDRPGLMMALVPGGSCHGVVQRLGDAGLEAAVGALVRRETSVKPMTNQPRWITALANGRRVPALAFTVGLFSILPALVGTTMQDLVEGLPFDAAVSGALLEQAGEAGALLAGVLAFERGDFEACESFGTDLLEVAEVYRAALAWVEQSAPHLA